MSTIPVERSARGGAVYSLGWLVFFAVLLSTGPATGQPDDADGKPSGGSDAASGDIVPPRVLQASEPLYPESVDPPIEASVLLALLVDETGTVSEVSVVEGPGEPFDAAALAAIQGFQFEPATQAGVAIAARIQYRLVFHPPVAPAPPPAAKPEAPPSAAKPEAQPPAPAPPEVITPAAPVPPALEEEEEFGATAEIEAPPRETTRRSIEKEELTRIPGTRGDALRAVEILPGVARTEFGGNDGPPIIRGAYPYESLVLLDGAPVPLLYHFGGLTSFYNSHLLEEVEFFPGNFSSRYGRAVGGVVSAKTRDPRSDGFHGMLELSLIDNFVLAETPVGDDTAIALAARRSNIDLVFDKLVPEDAYSVSVAPVYYDYQALLVHRFSHAHKLKLQAYGSYDRLKLVFANPTDDDPAFRDSVDGVLQFHRLQLGLESHLSPALDQNLELALGPTQAKNKIGAIDTKFIGLDLHARSEWSVFAHEQLRVDFGIDTILQTIDGEYIGPPPPQEEGNPSDQQPLGTYSTVRIKDSFPVFRPGAYLELSYRPLPEWLLIPGVRVDFHEDANAVTIDPRFSTRYSLSEATTLKGGVGVYSQSPEYYQLITPIGNPKLEPHHALHTSLGIEHAFGDSLEVGIDGFYKYLYNRVVGTAGGEPPRFVNDGVGRIYGGELSVELDHDAHFAYLAYTLSRSERRDRDEAWRLFDNDQMHLMSAVYNYDFGSGWSAGARYRLVSGNPRTPIVGNVYDANTDLYFAIYGETNSERAGMFHQLDVRCEKKWSFDGLAIAAYLEVLNAYNAKNSEGTGYSYDYKKSEDVTGLPIFPNLGIRGEL